MYVLICLLGSFNGYFSITAWFRFTTLLCFSVYNKLLPFQSFYQFVGLFKFFQMLFKPILNYAHATESCMWLNDQIFFLELLDKLFTTVQYGPMSVFCIITVLAGNVNARSTRARLTFKTHIHHSWNVCSHCFTWVVLTGMSHTLLLVCLQLLYFCLPFRLDWNKTRLNQINSQWSVGNVSPRHKQNAKTLF